jgi:hypothetical protein
MESRTDWRQLLPQLAGLPLLPMGPDDNGGSPGKVPADPLTGRNLVGWTTAAFTPEEVAGACSKISGVGFRPGPDAGGLIAFDIDGPTAVALLRGNDCDPLTAPTWQVRRDNNADRLKVIWRIPEDTRDHLPVGTPKLITKPPSGPGAKDGENVAYYYGAGQVVALGQHLESGGNYFWPEGHGPADVAEIPPNWWRMAWEVAERGASKGKASSKTSAVKGGWRRLRLCPICGRDERPICAQSQDGRFLACYHGGTFTPPEMRPGAVITGSDGVHWAHTGIRSHGDIGDFSHFKVDEPAERPDYTKGFPDHGDNAETGQQHPPDPDPVNSSAKEAPGKPAPEPEALSYSQLLSGALQSVREGKPDEEMRYRAELMSRFRRSDSQITKALFDLLTRQEGGTAIRSSYKPVDLDQIAGMDWLVEGFIPERDQVLLYGEAGAGKTTAAVGLAFAVIDGTGFLDRASCATKGNVLFIASDSGADPLKAALQGMDLMGHPALQPDSPLRFIVWAHEAEQGALAWEASLSGCIALLDFIRREGIALVLIDSAKAVTSKADLNYCDNAPVTALLTFAKEVLCRYCSIVWLHHDGTAKGASAGAKAWKEIPSVVHAIERVSLDGGGDDSAGGAGPRAETWFSDRLRWWKVKKCRLGTGREFQYELDSDTGRPALTPAGHRAVVQDAREAIVQVLWEAHQGGRPALPKRELADALLMRWKYSSKTTDNNLTRMVRSRAPEVCRLSAPKGHYKLAPRMVEVLSRAVVGEADPLNASMPQGKEQPQTTVIESDLVTSRAVPEGMPREQQSEPPPPAEFPRELLGNCQPASAGNESGHVPSRGTSTTRAREARPPSRSRQTMKGLWADPWPVEA